MRELVLVTDHECDGTCEACLKARCGGYFFDLVEVADRLVWMFSCNCGVLETHRLLSVVEGRMDAHYGIGAVEVVTVGKLTVEV